VRRDGEHQQLALPMVCVRPVPTADREFVWGVAVDRSGIGQYVHLIRATDDPERSPRPVGGRKDRAPHLTLSETPVARCREEIVSLLRDGRARTFNAIGVELLDHTADTLLGSPYDEALWDLIDRGVLEHTLDAPVLFRLRAPSDGRSCADMR
jgi:hypothetical protein